METQQIELHSGLWEGYYEQHGGQHPQQMTMEFSDGLIRGDGIDGLGSFLIDGEYRADQGAIAMGWIKTYDGGHSVLYLGTYDGTEIHGEWDIMGYAKDKFTFWPNRETR